MKFENIIFVINFILINILLIYSKYKFFNYLKFFIIFLLKLILLNNNLLLI